MVTGLSFMDTEVAIESEVDRIISVK
ncbi:uncharacterized protein G2W53_024349 [Senna tora]|uniref:Uncharacterized protein n=1 Tax=Senna tora TaxID=362788 RepID=A0A834TJZ8_9FABA|nr:uncharacterized protein G2W53_024349 [Senna tora]